MKKVLFVIPYLYEGGAERALSNIQNSFPKDWEIETLVNSEYKKAYKYVGIVHTLDIKDTHQTASIFFQLKAFFKRIKKLRFLKKTGNYTACISFMDSANVANILTGNKNTKVVISIRTSLKAMSDNPRYKYIVNPLAKILYNRANKVVAVSEEQRCELSREFSINDDKLVTISNGFDLVNISKLSIEQIDDDISQFIKGKRVILNVGRLTLSKGLHHLLRSFAYVLKVIPNTVLMIAGEGEIEEYLRGLSTVLGIEENVIFLGHVENVYKYIKISDLFVFPSLIEGFPNALAEAVCVGTPCIASDFKTGAREILAPELLFNGQEIKEASYCKYGILTPVCSGRKYSGTEPLEEQEKVLAKAIIDVLSDVQMMDNYREKSKERRKTLDIKDAVSKWIDVIEGK